MRSLQLALATVISSLPAAAAPALPADVPAELQPWAAWVLRGHERALCPLRTDGTPACESPGRLELVLDKGGGAFTASWRVDAAGVVPLPGDERHWPLDVEVDGRPAVVVGQAPGVMLEEGEHAAKGRFAWDALPESLAIPPGTATLKVTVDGRELPFVDRGDGGDRVWLKRAPAAEEREEDRLDVAVFRKIKDGVPLVVETQVLLEVSGKGREVTLPGALLPGFQPLALSVSLPVRVDGDALEVQVRPGRHTLTLVQRNDADVRALSAPATSMGGEGSEEVWVFEADHAVRVVNVTGVPSIVAEQTRLPDAWRALPAYRVLPGETFTLEQQRRGDENPAPSQLSLQRTLWLDFDGGGFTVHDELYGRFTGDRLLMGPGTTLGRVSTGDGPGDAFITRLGGAGDGQVGVEVRKPDLRVSADSRIEGTAALPAVSWAHDFQSVTASLHLPPGVKLFHAGGVDIVETTWLKSWTLFELFLVVIITVSMGRLWGPLVGGAALLCTVLTFQEDDAVRWGWIVVVVLAALHRVLPPSLEGRGIATALKWLRLATAVVVALVALGFSIQQIRMGMYPVLEQEHRAVGQGEVWGRGQYGGDIANMNGLVGGFAAKEAMPSAPPPPEPAIADEERGAFDKLGQVQGDLAEAAEVAQQVAQQAASRGENDFDARASSAGSGSSGSYEGKMARKKQKLQLIDPNAVVQTGPGLPQWGFTTVRLAFTGPVKEDQTISLVLVGPRANLALAFVRVLLTVLLVVVALGAPGRRWPGFFVKAFRGKGALFVGALVAVGLSSSGARAAEPSAATLEQLRNRLLEKPACSPACASIARLALDAADGRLRLRAEVHALADVAVPLPGADQQWSAQTVIVDGRPWPGAVRDGGSLWVVLSPGRHDVVLEGALPRRDTVQLALPLVAHRASFTSTTWTLEGIGDDGVPGGNLQLTRVAAVAGATDADPSADGGDDVEKGAVLPPFLSVERSLLLGLSFEVETRVVRLSPPGMSVLLEVPLLPGESVTTDGVRAEGGKAFVSLGPNDTEVSFSGVLAPVEKLVLEAKSAAAGQPAFVEVWRLEASPVWHVEEEGIPPLHAGAGDGAVAAGGARRAESTWRPWPGEKLALSVTRPEGVPGQTVTVERTSQLVRPGISSTDVTLTLVLRASRGGEHVVTIPADAELLSATVEGRQQPLRPDAAGKVRVPLVPGKQEVVMQARVASGVALLLRTPLFDVGSPSVNAEIVVDVPSDRWILFATGPRAGPAVLFWSFIVVLLLTGVALSRVPFSPLRLHHWVLLGLGLTQVPLPAAALVAGWLLALGVRKKHPIESAGLFNLFQLLLVGWTGVALIALVASIHEGLLGAPDMQIAGNGSTSDHLRWFQDHAPSTLPQALVVNAPLAAYRVSMLAWALWLAFSLLGWLRAGFAAFAEGGMWKAMPKPPPRPRPGSPAAMAATGTAKVTATKVPEAPPGAPTSAAVPSGPGPAADGDKDRPDKKG